MLLAILVLLLVRHEPSFSMSPMLTSLEAQSQVSSMYGSFLRNIYSELSYQTILLLKRSRIECPMDGVVFQSHVPFILATNGESFYLKRNFNTELLAIVCMEADLDAELLDVMSRTLQHMRQTRLILIVLATRTTGTTATTGTDELLRPLLLHFDRDRLTNVLVLFADFGRSGTFYRVHPFPTYGATREEHSQTGRYYPLHWANMQGRKLLTMPDLIAPRSLWAEDDDGRPRLSGYVALTIMLFAELYNATLQFLEPSGATGQMLHSRVLKNWTQRGVLDIPMGIIGVYSSNDAMEMSYPLEITQWQVMVPCSDLLPTSRIYTMIVERHLVLLIVLLVVVLSVLHALMERLSTGGGTRRSAGTTSCYFNINLLLSDRVIPGILGQTFILQASPMLSLKLLYMIIFLLGLVLNTLFAAHLKTLLTSHPSMPELSSFEDMRRAKLRLMVDENELGPLKRFIGDGFYDSVKDIVQPEGTEHFQRQRIAMDPTHAYTVTMSLWLLFERQQMYFKRDLFCTTPTLQLTGHLALAFPLEENSVFREPLERLLLRVHDVGLLAYWQTRTYFDMLATGQFSMRDMSKDVAMPSLAVEDLHYVWLVFTIGLALAAIALLGEVLGQWLRCYRGETS